MSTPTEEMYGAFQRAFEHFNDRLFEGSLLPVIVTLPRRRRCLGYFLGGSFDGAGTVDEIAMNPDHFAERSLEEIMSTLVHEMTHHWQHHFGTPGKGRYHNREWADKMRELGLEPISLDGGASGTGNNVTHEVRDGPFREAFRALRDVRIRWSSRPREPAAPKNSRIKLICPGGCQHVWGAQKNNLLCGECGERLQAKD